MNDEQRIKNLQKIISEQNNSLRANLQKRIWITVGLVIFIFCYMTFITISIARTVNPENVADIVLGTMAMKAPEIRTNMIKTAEDSIPGIIDTGFEQAYDMLPQLREILKEQVENSVPSLPPEFYAEIAKEVSIHFSAHQGIMESLLGKIDNEQDRKEFIQTLSEGLQDNIESFMTEAMNETDLVKDKLDYLVTAQDKKLTREQLQTKKILIYFLYLAKHYNDRM